MSVIPAVLGERPLGQAAGVPYSPLYDDLYHPATGALAQARHVFLGGNELPARWAGRDHFVILETGFGLGNNFLATWAAWLADPQRCARLVFISIEKHPLQKADLAHVHEHTADPAPTALTQRLLDAWPVLTAGLHTLQFDEGAASGVTLLLGLGDVADLLPQIVAQVDAFYLDGFSPAKNPHMWDQGLLSRLGRLAAPGATAATWSAARGVREGLALSGFKVEEMPGYGGGKRDMTRAIFEPRHTPPHLPGGLRPSALPASQRHAMIIGAGLAGCAAAWALARQGWRCTVIDAHKAPAQAASGNPGGLFHSIVHADDGLHARAHRAAALRTAQVVAPWLAQGRLHGQCQGLLRLAPQTDHDSAQALIQRLGLPPDYVRWLAPSDAAAIAGIPVPSGGWLFMQGGWLHPAGLAQAFLEEATSHAQVKFVGERRVQQLQRHADGAWQALDEQGEIVAQAAVVVLAGANDTHPLIASLTNVSPLPMSSVRGQVSILPLAPRTGSAVPGPRAPLLPVAGAGYVLPEHQGNLLCGATSQVDDDDVQVREVDHAHNLQLAAQLGSLPEHYERPQGLIGRVGWRATTPDRLPYVGALPLVASKHAPQTGRAPRMDQPRFVPRLRDEQGGVYVMTGLGSRGITWAALAGELLASWVTGSPCPVEAALRDALDPARIVTRAVAKGAQAEASD
ncbi:MAG: bifunctional tRNA (5-methylaminomethyl-2-thiouridine)(34)-methyltransferase MnmD/FAD-dependent 5-carboxymethylaminomethyl-2-thiouridine(34) oxidoreductase MnmC [Pseudomonadota bacterium]